MLWSGSLQLGVVKLVSYLTFKFIFRSNSLNLKVIQYVFSIVEQNVSSSIETNYVTDSLV